MKGLENTLPTKEENEKEENNNNENTRLNKVKRIIKEYS